MFALPHLIRAASIGHFAVLTCDEEKSSTLM
jgi:hypothetical protein